jgi:hypothetical protein
MTRQAACSCGQLRLEVDGNPVRVSVCHCLACQRRTGNVFGAQARFVEEDVRIEGHHTDYTRISDDGEARTSSFCPECGATVFVALESAPGFIAVPVGAFADPGFPPPVRSIYESRQHSWVVMPDSIADRAD